MKPEVATRRIEAFEQRFGEAHLYFAYQAAFPLALTPDLLYRLWANFQRDIHGADLKIPWLAVADLLLSSLCDEVGHELYEMDTAVRNALLKELKENPRFGEKRIHELSDFLLTYIQQQIESHDPDIRDFAQVQRWTALAYTKPSEAARELASVLAGLKFEEKAEWVRMASVIETFAEPLAGFEPLLVYARGMQKFVRGKQESAIEEITQLLGEKGSELQISGVQLSIPKEILDETISQQILEKFNSDKYQTRRTIASDWGLAIVDSARTAKGWNKDELSWIEKARIAKDTLRRFWLRLPIYQKSFISICESVGIENWQDITDPQQPGHFSALRTKITDIEILKTSLRDLGIAVKTEADVRGWNGQRVKADVVAVLEGKYDMGWLKNSDGSFDLVADLRGIAERHNHVELVNAINQKYAMNKSLLERAYFTINITAR